MRRRRFVSGLLGAAAGGGLLSAAPAAALAGRGPAARSAAEAGEWRHVAAPDGLQPAYLTAVAAAGPERAWAVGAEDRDAEHARKPLAYAWDGAAWFRTDLGHLGYRGQLSSVATNSTGSAWAIGYDSSGVSHLLAWDGDTWQETPFPRQTEAGTRLSGVVVAPDGEAWAGARTAVGAGLLHWNGRHWHWSRPHPGGTAAAPSGIHRTPQGEIWLYGTEIVARWDGAWTDVPLTPDARGYTTGLLPVAHDDIWLPGYNLYLVGGRPPAVNLRHWDGSTWSRVTLPFGGGTLGAIVGDAQGRPDRIAGWDVYDPTRAHHLRWDGGNWVSERGPVATTSVVMNGLARIPGTGDYWAVGTTSLIPGPSNQLRVERFVA